MTWINHKWFFRKKNKNHLLINALSEASKAHPNDQALGSVVRNFCIKMEGKENFTEEYEMKKKRRLWGFNSIFNCLVALFLVSIEAEVAYYSQKGAGNNFFKKVQVDK